MKKLFTSVLFLFILIGCNISNLNEDENQTKIVGSGSVISEELSFTDIDGLSNLVFNEVIIRTGRTQKITIYGQKNILDQINYKVTGTKLDISVNENISIQTDKELKLEMTVKEFNYLTEIGGAAYNLINGSVDNLYINVVGGAIISAENYLTKNCDISITGAALVYVNVSDNLKANIVGSGIITYKGDPEVTSTIVGQGEVKKSSN